jgi:putative ABC transport system permease protein
VWAELYGPDAAALASAASAAMGPGFDATTGAELAVERAATADREAQTVRNFLLAFAGVALMAGMFVIANTFTMLVAQRTRHFALLRAIGARRAQVRRAVLGEALVVGLVGATVGVLLGVGLGWLAMTLLRTTGETVIFTVSPLSIVVGYAVGVVVTIVAAYGSARRGALVPPVAALGTDLALPRRSLVARTVAGLAALAVGVSLVVATSGPDLTDEKRAIGMGGALVGWVGVLLLAPLLASAVLEPLARLVSRHGSALSRLAVRNAIRDPRRTAATASALMIGLALVAAFATVGSTFTSTMTEVIRGDLPAGTSVVRSAQPWSPLPDPVLAQVAAVSAVDSLVAPVQFSGTVSLSSGEQARLSVTAVEASGLGRALTPRLDSGTASLADSGVLLPSDFATRYHVAVGDRVTVAAEESGSVTGRVSGIYRASDALRGAVVDKARLPASATAYLAAIFVVGADPHATRQALDAAFAERPDIVVLSREEMIASYTSNVEFALNIVYGLLGAAVIIAIFGVVNTMALSVLERTREIGVFRAVGANRRLVRRSIRRESIIIASYGGLLGVLVGILLGGVMQHVLLGTPILSLTVPLPFVVGALGGMVLVGVLAAWWPARRAARIDVLRAIAAV